MSYCRSRGQWVDHPREWGRPRDYYIVLYGLIYARKQTPLRRRVGRRKCETALILNDFIYSFTAAVRQPNFVIGFFASTFRRPIELHGVLARVRRVYAVSTAIYGYHIIILYCDERQPRTASRRKKSNN